MSSGSFVVAKYECDDLSVATVRIQPETENAWNEAPTGTVTRDRVRVSGGKRKIGRKTRMVTLKQAVGSPVNGYQAYRYTSVPVLSLDSFAALSEGDTVSYAGASYIVAGKSKESGAGIL